MLSPLMLPEGLAAAAAAAALFLRIHMGCVQNLHPEHGLYVCEFDQDLEEMVSQQFKPQ